MTRWFAAIAIGLMTASMSSAASTRELVLFTVEIDGKEPERFVVATDDDDLVARCRAELARPADERDLFPIGPVVAGHGGFNTVWTWHLDPDGWDLTEASIEACDGRPSHLEMSLDSWLADVGAYCPWGGRIVAEGPPETVAEHAGSHTGRYLREVLATSRVSA